jgi:hypothetical protein
MAEHSEEKETLKATLLSRLRGVAGGMVLATSLVTSFDTGPATASDSAPEPPSLRDRVEQVRDASKGQVTPQDESAPTDVGPFLWLNGGWLNGGGWRNGFGPGWGNGGWHNGGWNNGFGWRNGWPGGWRNGGWRNW